MVRATAVVPTQRVPRLLPPGPATSEPVRETPRWQRSGPLRTTLRYLALWALAAFFLMPIYVLIVTSFKNPADVSVTRIWELPTSLSFDNFGAVLPKLSSGFRNSLALSIPASLISALLGCANGFVLAKFRFPLSNLVFPLILFGIFVPYQAVIIPVSQTMTSVGLRGSGDATGGLLGLMLIHIIYGLPITTLIFRNHFVSMPNALLESARLDGAGVLRTWVDLAVPLSKPAFAVAVIWQFTSTWNDFMFGAMMTSRDSWPVTIALNNVAGGQSVPFGQAMAGALLVSLPTLAIYILLGRFFMRGLLAGTLQD